MIETKQHIRMQSQYANAPLWFQGVQRYQQCGYVRPACKHPVIWSHGDVRLLKVAADLVYDDNAPVLLCVPSLINRYYIMDIDHRISMARWFALRGMHVYIIDWGEPSPDDAGKDAASYIMQYVLPIIRHVTTQHVQPVSLMGYCLGGLLSLGAASVAKELVRSLTLLATPWDFKVGMDSGVQHAASAALAESQPLMAGETLSWLFYLAQPDRFRQKYAQFMEIEHDSDAYHRFVTVEHWVNDAVPLTRALAHDCFTRWMIDNQLARYRWRVGGRMVDPSTIAAPLCVVAPTRDHIVTQDNALALARCRGDMPTVTVTPDTGHLGMIVGHQCKAHIWPDIYRWMQSVM